MKPSIKFLQDIYHKQCEKGDYIILSVKGPNIKWKDVSIPYNNLDKGLKRFFKDYPHNLYDLYWSPMPYSKPNRRIDNSLPSKYLAQDIDEFEDVGTLDPKPTILWESSPGKYQGLWELDRYIEESEYTPLNKGLAEFIGCDDCFDYTHVYRIPGTTNHKYKNKPLVEMPEVGKKLYKPKNLRKLVSVKESKPSQKVEMDFSTISLTERQLYANYSMPKKVMDLLALRDISSLDRSSTIWYIENKLLDIGMSPDEVIFLVKNSAFNKYKGRNDEDKRLRKELDKIIGGKLDNDISNDESLGDFTIDSYDDVMSNMKSFPGWLIEGFWGRRSHGIVAGQPKVFKSTFTQDLVVSVASGAPFLGKYRVLEPGPVIVVQNENADWIMKDRTEKIISHRGLVGNVSRKRDIMKIKFPPNLPIHFINQQGFSMSSIDHKKQLEELVQRVKPVLVVFDPLYLMFDGDLNKASELNPALQWLLHLKNNYKTGVMVIHHYNKGGNATQTRGGQKMMGSGILHGWIESAWYLKRSDEDLETPLTEEDIDTQSSMPSKVIMDREFRLAGTFPQVQLDIKMGVFGDPYYHVEVNKVGEDPTKAREQIITLLKQHPNGLTRQEIKDHGLNPSLIDDMRLFKNGRYRIDT